MSISSNACRLVIYLILISCLFAVSSHHLIQAEEEERQGLVDNGKKKEYARLHENLWSKGDTNLEIVSDRRLKIELVAQSLEFPTTMTFIGPDDILVLEKEKGTVRRIVNSNLVTKPLLEVNMTTSLETCMCGIAMAKINMEKSYVFLYFTEVTSTNSKDNTVGDTLLANRLYRYEFVNDTLQNPALLMDLPSTAGPHHTGGAIMVGSDNNVYLPVGDLDNIRDEEYFDTKAQNVYDSKEPDGRAGILRLTQDGHPVDNGILGKEHPLNLYYAYGIRNSFGMDFDPLTGKLWDTENGPAYGDEINLVEPGFNSGWNEVQGIWKPHYDKAREADFVAGDELLNPSGHDLVDFGIGKYSAPEFIWEQTVGPTALKFLNSDKYGEKYKNDMFVADTHGKIYHFDLNKDRTQLVLAGKLEDKIADTDQEINESDIIFGRGFGGVTDIEVGPYDGYLYIVSIGEGKIFRIVPNTENPRQ